MPTCLASGCSHTTENLATKKVFFPIPKPINEKELQRAARWLYNIGNGDNVTNFKFTHNKTLCEDHFHPLCYGEDHQAKLLGLTEQRKILLAGAVPTIFSHKVYEVINMDGSTAKSILNSKELERKEIVKKLLLEGDASVEKLSWKEFCLSKNREKRNSEQAKKKMSSRKSKIVVDKKESRRVLKVADQLFSVDVPHTERNIFKSLQNIIQKDPSKPNINLNNSVIIRPVNLVSLTKVSDGNDVTNKQKTATIPISNVRVVQLLNFQNFKNSLCTSNTTTNVTTNVTTAVTSKTTATATANPTATATANSTATATANPTATATANPTATATANPTAKATANPTATAESTLIAPAKSNLLESVAETFHKNTEIVLTNNPGDNESIKNYPAAVSDPVEATEIVSVTADEDFIKAEEEEFLEIKEADDASVRRSKRKRMAKIKSDEPYKRKKLGAKKLCHKPFDTSPASDLNESLPDLNSSTVENTEMATPNKDISLENNIDISTSKLENDVADRFMVISPLKSDFVKLGPTISCFKCASIFETRYAIVFTQRFYCCRECLPAETTREMRLGSIIKQCNQSVTARNRRERRSPKNYAMMDSTTEITCPTPSCDGRGHVNGKYLKHRSVLSCPKAEKNISKKEARSEPSSTCTSPASDSVFKFKRSNSIEHLTQTDGTQVDKTARSAKREKWKCPFPGCDGKGHNNGKYPTHRSLLGCPIARSLKKETVGSKKCPLPSYDSSGSLLAEELIYDSLSTYPNLNVEHEKYATHISVSTCARATNFADYSKLERSKQLAQNETPKSSESRNVFVKNEASQITSTGDILKEFPVLCKEVKLLQRNNDEIKFQLPNMKLQLKKSKTEHTVATQKIDRLLVADHQLNNQLRDRRMQIENAIKSSNLPIHFAHIPVTGYQQFFEELKKYFDTADSVQRSQFKNAFLAP